MHFHAEEAAEDLPDHPIVWCDVVWIVIQSRVCVCVLPRRCSSNRSVVMHPYTYFSKHKSCVWSLETYDVFGVELAWCDARVLVT